MMVEKLRGGNMATKTIKTYFRLRRGTSDAWTRVNPVLLYGEPGFEKDTNKLKIGDGTHAWNDLAYLGNAVDISADGKSIVYNNDAIQLYGYDDAQVGQIPVKGEDNLEWIDQSESISNEEIIEICS